MSLTNNVLNQVQHLKRHVQYSSPRSYRIGFILGGWKNFKDPLHSWQWGVNPSILWRPPYIAYTAPFFSPPTPTPHVLSVVLFLGWMGDRATSDVLFYSLMIWIYTSSLGTLVTEGPWCVFYTTRRQVYWGLTHK